MFWLLIFIIIVGGAALERRHDARKALEHERIALEREKRRDSYAAHKENLREDRRRFELQKMAEVRRHADEQSLASKEHRGRLALGVAQAQFASKVAVSENARKGISKAERRYKRLLKAQQARQSPAVAASVVGVPAAVLSPPPIVSETEAARVDAWVASFSEEMKAASATPPVQVPMQAPGEEIVWPECY